MLIHITGDSKLIIGLSKIAHKNNWLMIDDQHDVFALQILLILSPTHKLQDFDNLTSL